MFHKDEHPGPHHRCSIHINKQTTTPWMSSARSRMEQTTSRRCRYPFHPPWPKHPVHTTVARAKYISQSQWLKRPHFPLRSIRGAFPSSTPANYPLYHRLEVKVADTSIGQSINDSLLHHQQYYRTPVPALQRSHRQSRIHSRTCLTAHRHVRD